MFNELLDLQSLNISLSYPFLFLIAIATLLLLCSAFYKFHCSFYVAIGALSLCISFFLLLSNVSKQGFTAKAFLDTLNNDILAFYASCILLLFAFFYLLIEREEKQAEFYSLFLFMVASFELMVSSSNLILIFIGLESSSLALYTLIAMRGTTNAISSAIKYFTLAAVSSGFFVLSCAFIYMKTGTLDLSKAFVWNRESKDIFLLSAGVCIFVLCALKLSLIPFHFWLRDVYSAARTNLVAFISVVPKIAIFVVIIRIFAFLRNTGFESIVVIVTLFSMFVAALAALVQTDLKKMFAYSSIVHSSFVLTALIPLLQNQGDDLSPLLKSLFIYWVFFAFANYGVFLILSRYKRSLYESVNALLYKKPLIAFSLSICVLSLAGIPPFGVFWGKVMVLQNMINWGYWYIALCIALVSVIILYAYFKIIIHIFFIKERSSKALRLDMKQNCILLLCVFASVFAVLFLL
ncbi:NADH-quinone oxidoreductase subunit N [Campylobacter sp. MIT 21-1685]|uniref:NADH-quinone oxidoreductase subunit N n=1 Tax=unclassified Campylobacter TaxID=2593542 RepID=UPI00224AB06C|nr:MULTISPECIES: NADH-quinone oxidoreductase subunit N [unclassified Campylobacter]MCX2682657.1 NADH-quinone oxidoreductase subunit N [Campylobacter sp. MIT 21-1684]MCX2750937.1 NADH-quinone oxidoreductase subunit N [Campylobacter sp. MIT 21-1682]MCX2807130.1 NADH-quinone oxidoreductase subunit N [Campylobacter sp. MIT 21-1685]